MRITMDKSNPVIIFKVSKHPIIRFEKLESSWNDYEMGPYLPKLPWQL
jgi:hypothetical protein